MAQIGGMSQFHSVHTLQTDWTLGKCAANAVEVMLLVLILRHLLSIPAIRYASMFLVSTSVSMARLSLRVVVTHDVQDSPRGLLVCVQTGQRASTATLNLSKCASMGGHISIDAGLGAPLMIPGFPEHATL